ncbi:hypothetical protein RCCS2_17816 [Roseobacter sp. CCS2]|nr:hypothetical protein RCCS2_17816 [Roseobacter sp. CCS2]
MALTGRIQIQCAGMVKRYHESFPSFSYGFDSRYPLQMIPKFFAFKSKLYIIISDSLQLL